MRNEFLLSFSFCLSSWSEKKDGVMQRLSPFFPLKHKVFYTYTHTHTHAHVWITFRDCLDFSMSQPQKHGGPWATEIDIIYEHRNRRVVCVSLRQLMFVCVCHSVNKHKIKQQEIFWLCVRHMVCGLVTCLSICCVSVCLSLSCVCRFVICWYQLQSQVSRNVLSFILSFICPFFQILSVLFFFSLTYHNFISPQMRWKSENVIKCFIMVHHRVIYQKLKFPHYLFLFFPNPNAGKQKQTF